MPWELSTRPRLKALSTQYRLDVPLHRIIGLESLRSGMASSEYSGAAVQVALEEEVRVVAL
jgi:hypothetical protein